MRTVIYVEDLNHDTIIRSVAKQYLRSMVEIQQDMFLDESPEEQDDFTKRVTAETIREMAASYASDMIAEFQEAVENEINWLVFNTKFEVERRLKAEVNFCE